MAAVFFLVFSDVVLLIGSRHSTKPTRYGAAMDQSELVEKVAQELGITHVSSQRLLKATLREIRDLLRVGHAVTIPHLGTFDTATYEAHRGYRPVSHDFAIFPKRRVPVFRTGTLLRDEVYDIETDEAGVPT
jgi:DNA-binding protein HU-beta